MLSKKHDKILKDVNAIYSYILSSDEIKKLAKDIVRITNFKKKIKKSKINEKDIMLITYADSIKSYNKKSLTTLNIFFKKFCPHYLTLIFLYLRNA